MAEGLAARREEGDRCFELAPVGQRAGHDEPAFDENLPVHAGLAQRVPNGDDGFVVTESPLAVGDHRMLVERPGEVVESPKLASRLPPAAEPVKREAVQLSKRPDLRRQPGEHAQLRERLPVPVALVGTARDAKAPLQSGGAIGTDCPP